MGHGEFLFSLEEGLYLDVDNGVGVDEVDEGSYQEGGEDEDQVTFVDLQTDHAVHPSDRDDLNTKKTW